MKLVRFTDEEIQATRQMLDVALKAIGRQAATAFLVIDKKLENAEEEEIQEKPRIVK